MSKQSLRAILLAAAAVFSLNLLYFNYSQHVILPALGAVLLLLALIGVGDALAAWLRIAPAGVMDKAALGMMASTAYFYLAGSLRVMNRFTVLLFFAASLGVAAWRALGGRPRDGSGLGLARFLSRPPAEFAGFLLPLVYAALPPSFYDSLVYHLGIPNLYLQSGGFVATPQFVYANTFIYYEISLVPAVFLGDLVPRLFHFFFGALFVLSVADEAAEHWGVQKRLNLVLALASLPMTLFLLTTCKNDLAGAAFIFLAIRQARRGHWKLSAAFWGFAVGIKYFNLLPLAIFLLVAAKPWTRAGLKRSALAALIVLLAVAPLLLKNLHFTGNPFFPFLPTAFPSAYWDSDRFDRLQADVGRMARAPADFVRLPYSLSFFNHGYGGLVGPLFLVLLPFLLLSPARDGRWLAWALLLLGCAPYFTASLRFVYAAFVVLAIFAVRACEHEGSRPLRVIFTALVACNFVLGFAMLEKFYQAHSLVGGGLTPEEYKERFFPTYPAFSYLDAHAPARAKVLVVGEARNFYLHRPYQLSSALDYGILRKYVSGGRSAGEFLAAVNRDGFSYLVVNFREMDRLQGAYANLSAAEARQAAACLEALPPLFRRGPVAVYRTD